MLKLRLYFNGEMDMNKDKKIELQTRIIHELQEENTSLIARIKELEKIVNDNQKIIDATTTYREEQEKCILALNDARQKYLQAAKDMMEQKKNYTKDMKDLLKTIKKNI